MALTSNATQEYSAIAEATDVTPPLQFCTFYVDGLLFGIDVQHVQEVILNQPMTRVPLMPEVLRGLINLRGQIIPAIDLRMKLELREREYHRAAGQRGRAHGRQRRELAC